MPRNAGAFVLLTAVVVVFSGCDGNDSQPTQAVSPRTEPASPPPAAPSAPPRVASIVVTPDSATVQVGWTLRLSAATKDATGAILTGRAVTFSTSSERIATLAAAPPPALPQVDEFVSGIAPGVATITVSSEGATTRVDLVVSRQKPAQGKIAFLSDHDGSVQVYEMSGDGSDVRQVTRGADWKIPAFSSGLDAFHRLTWSPAAPRLALSAGAGIAVINSADGASSIVAQGENAAWTPDGSKIRFMDSKNGFVTDTAAGVYEITADGAGLALLATRNFLAPTTPRDSARDAYAFQWSPDLRQVVFQRTSLHFITQIYAASADGSQLRQLVGSPGCEGAPAWSPDGTTIAFWACAYGFAMIGSDGSGAVRTIYDDGFLHYGVPRAGTLGVFNQLSWSPDGRQIAFLRSNDASGFSEIWVFDISSATTFRRLSPEGFSAWGPAWR